MTEPGFGQRALALIWLTVLVVHVIAAVLWLWLQPGGFPVWHARFWVNGVVPILVLGWGMTGLRALHRRLPSLGIWLSAWPILWVGMAITGRMCFPVTLASLWLIPFVGGLVLAASLVLMARPFNRWLSRSAPLVLAGWLVLGAFCVLSQRPPSPSTTPARVTLDAPDTPVAAQSEIKSGMFSLGQGAYVYPRDGTINFRLTPITLQISPLLRFLSVSPDGCWTVFVHPDVRDPAEPRLLPPTTGSGHELLASYEMPFAGKARLYVESAPEHGRTLIEATTQVPRHVFSHLNSFCDLEVRGHRRLWLSFSPCSATRVEVLKFDYPVGRPSRFAFLDAKRRFRIVEATSGEKGPFKTLAEGLLERNEPLAITLHDEERKIAVISLEDWANQAGTELSPTAGWGVLVNAIEFSLTDLAPGSPASIFITLAATSVGRGWDCVTLPAGTYRNRMAVETFEPTPR